MTEQEAEARRLASEEWHTAIEALRACRAALAKAEQERNENFEALIDERNKAVAAEQRLAAAKGELESLRNALISDEQEAEARLWGYTSAYGEQMRERLAKAEQERDEKATEAYENGYALGLAQGWEKGKRESLG